jgi:hypothetical protein
VLLSATAELEPSASVRSGTLSKLQLDPREVGSADLEEGPEVVFEVVSEVCGTDADEGVGCDWTTGDSGFVGVDSRVVGSVGG